MTGLAFSYTLSSFPKSKMLLLSSYLFQDGFDIFPVGPVTAVILITFHQCFFPDFTFLGIFLGNWCTKHLAERSVRERHWLQIVCASAIVQGDAGEVTDEVSCDNFVDEFLNIGRCSAGICDYLLSLELTYVLLKEWCEREPGCIDSAADYYGVGKFSMYSNSSMLS